MDRLDVLATVVIQLRWSDGALSFKGPRHDLARLTAVKDGGSIGLLGYIDIAQIRRIRNATSQVEFRVEQVPKSLRRGRLPMPA